MPILTDVLANTQAQAVQVQQIVDALKGTPNKGVPVSLISLNDSGNYSLTVQNDDPVNSRALSVLKADGTNLISADANGVSLGGPLHVPAGTTLTSPTLTSPHFTSPVVDSGGLTITAGNFVAGGVTIPATSTPTTYYQMILGGTVAGTTTGTSSGISAGLDVFSAFSVPNAQSEVLVIGGVIAGGLGTVAAGMQLTLNGLTASTGTTITNNYGIYVGAVSTGVSNYGIYINAPSGGTTNVGLLNLGTTQLTGGVGIGTSPPATTGLVVAGSPPNAPLNAIAYSGLLGQGNGAASTTPLIKGTGLVGPVSTGGAGWIQLNTNSTMIYIPYWT